MKDLLYKYLCNFLKSKKKNGFLKKFLKQPSSLSDKFLFQPVTKFPLQKTGVSQANGEQFAVENKKP
jgi:hypothetical protein